MVSISSKSEVFEFSGGQKPPIKGVTFDLCCPFSNSAELFPVQNHVLKFGLDWLKSEVC